MSTEKGEKKENELLEFFIGFILLGVGLYMLAQQVDVRMSWYSWHFGSFRLATGMVFIPLIFGVIWQIINNKSKLAKALTILGVVIIVATIIMSVSIVFRTTSMYNYIIILLMISVGTGLLLRVLFKDKKKDKNEEKESKEGE